MFRRRKNLIVFLNAMSTGFFAGFFLSAFHIAIHYFNISKVSHEMVLNLFFIEGDWINKWYGYIFFIFFISFLSIFSAILYYLLFRKIKGCFVGFVYGVIFWMTFGFLIPLLFYNMSFSELFTSRTNVATICSFILYGIFIGYSISYDYEITIQDHHIEQTD